MQSESAIVTDFIDIQINGYAGVDFNQSNLSLSDLQMAAAALRRDGVQQVFPTIITDALPTMRARIARLAELRAADPALGRLIGGIHVEGPFISPVRGYVGAHPVAHAQQATWDKMAPLLEAGQGLVRIVTLAPEQDPQQEVTRRLADQGIVVAAGHTDATLDQLDACIDAGLTLFTHLGNGCPRLMDRHDNIVQRALSRSPALMYSLIADGAHLPFFALKNYLDLVGHDRAIIVTDAIAAAGCGPGRYQLGDREVEVGEDGVPRADDDSHLVGSGTIMSQMADNLRRELGLTPVEIRRLTQANPLRLLDDVPTVVPPAAPRPLRVQPPPGLNHVRKSNDPRTLLPER